MSERTPCFVAWKKLRQKLRQNATLWRVAFQIGQCRDALLCEARLLFETLPPSLHGADLKPRPLSIPPPFPLSSLADDVISTRQGFGRGAKQPFPSLGTFISTLNQRRDAAGGRGLAGQMTSNLSGSHWLRHGEFTPRNVRPVTSSLCGTNCTVRLSAPLWRAAAQPISPAPSHVSRWDKVIFSLINHCDACSDVHDAT